MRGSKEEEGLRGPMFPRLNVNDTEKGGPRAPPRNKMALYEQLSIPSQRFGSGSLGNSESSLVSSMSSGHASIFERSVFTPFGNNSPAPSHSVNSCNPYSNRVELSNKISSEEQRAVNSPYDQSLSSTQPLSSSAKCNSFQLHNSNFKHYSKDRENQPYWNLSFPMQFKNISEKQKGEIGFTNLRARESLSNQTEESRKISNACQKVLSTDSLKRAHPSSYQEKGTCKVDSSKRLCGVNDQSDQDFVAIEETTGHQDKSRGIDKNKACKVTNESSTKSSPKVEKRSHNLIESGNKAHEGRKHGSLQVVDLQRHDLPEASENYTLSAMNITPDDVVKILGEKHFWKARKAIVDQQRTFGLQVFELHRLMKVQKLIAESPDLLLEDNIYQRKASSKSSQSHKGPSEHAKQQQQQPLITKSREKSPKPNEHAADTRPSPWCVPAPGNQWLVPVMSPSEGLIYKPYTAPCDPNTGYMPPIYPNYAGRGDFLNAVYGQTYFRPCGMPMMSSSFSGSAVEQSSCNMSSQMTCRVGKETEIQGSTGSNGQALALFPTEPTSQSSDQDQQTHVIKVVPRNRKLAMESAARIFRSITEERKQCCL